MRHVKNSASEYILRQRNSEVLKKKGSYSNSIDAYLSFKGEVVEGSEEKMLMRKLGSDGSYFGYNDKALQEGELLKMVVDLNDAVAQEHD